MNVLLKEEFQLISLAKYLWFREKLKNDELKKTQVNIIKRLFQTTSYNSLAAFSFNDLGVLEG